MKARFTAQTVEFWLQEICSVMTQATTILRDDIPTAALAQNVYLGSGRELGGGRGAREPLNALQRGSF